MLFLYFWTLSMLKLPTECMLVSKELKVISHFVSFLSSLIFVSPFLLQTFTYNLLSTLPLSFRAKTAAVWKCWKRRKGKPRVTPQSLYALTSFSSSRNTATKAALYLSKNNRSNFGKYTLSVRNRLHIKQKYCHFGTVT